VLLNAYLFTGYRPLVADPIFVGKQWPVADCTMQPVLFFALAENDQLTTAESREDI